MPVTAIKKRASIATFFLVSLLVLLEGAPAFAIQGQTAAGAVITNHAEATYLDGSGTSFSTVSPTISITVIPVATLSVTPKETEPSASVGPNQTVTRVFHVCNTGNTTDLYTITRATVTSPAQIAALYFDNDNSGILSDGDTLITIDATMSRRIPPGSCIGVLAVIQTNDFPANSLLTIGLTARSNVVDAVNGRPQDTGTIINAVGSGAHLTSPDDPGLPPTKTVNGASQAVVNPGIPFTYTIAFRNNGDIAAQNVVVADDLPAALQYVPGTLHLDGRSLTDAQDGDEGFVLGNHVEVHIAQVVPQQVVKINFNATISSTATSGVGVVNYASLSASNVAPVKSSTAVVLMDPFGTVFAGRGGASDPVAGARVEIFTDQSGTNLLGVPPDAGFAPNVHNTNPFVSDGVGHFSFGLTPQQLGSIGAPTRYFIRVTAQGFITRLLQIVIQPSGSGLFMVTVSALDGEPLARAGGFDLVRGDVTISDLADIALNIPLFEQNSLSISKSVDKPRAEIGDIVTYRIDVQNPTAAPIDNVVVTDLLPASFHYVKGTGRLGIGAAADRPIEPDVQGNQLLFQIGQIPHGSVAHVLYRVRIGANAHQGDQENSAVANGVFPSGERIATPPARAIVQITGTAFSTNQVLIGRVFEDANHNGVFDGGDKPMPGVRLYLNNGQSVITDSQGLYSFPSLGDGPVVISLDPLGLPERYALFDGGSLSGRSWTRLLRTPVGGGALLRQNFALIKIGKPGNAKADSLDVANANLSGDSSAVREAHLDGSASRGDGMGEKPVSRVSGQDAQVVNMPETTGVVPAVPTAAGTYKLESNETVEEVAPGEVKVLKPAPSSVIMAAAMELDARVALDWKAGVEVNGEHISEKSIGTSRLDQKNKVATFTFVGISLRPGPNQVRVTAIGPDGSAGRTETLTVLGRGPARRIEIVADKTNIQAGGRDSTIVHFHAFDQWGSPATDAQVAVEVSRGQLLRPSDKTSAPKPQSNSNLVAASPPERVSAEQVDAVRSQMITQLDGGEAALRLVGSGSPGDAIVHALTGQIDARETIHIIPENRPAILVGLAEITVGQAVPEVSLRGEEGHERSRLSFFYSGRLWGNNMLTLAYDSQRPINRTDGHNRLFQLDPLDRVYPLFGDSSTRFEAAQSNSKVYARLDHNRSYAMFGDFDTDMDDLALSGYSRKLTGVKLHLEDSHGDFVTVTGARPDTAFARDVFPAGALSLMRLSYGEILGGSEEVTLEVRDRRNPALILSREPLVRSVDYNLNTLDGELFLLRYVSTFDAMLNLVQIVVTYEHRANGLSSSVYTARAVKSFSGLGLRLGLSGVMQHEANTGNFFLGGIDAEKKLPRRGLLRFAWARSEGEITGTGNSFDSDSPIHNGDAYQAQITEPLPWHEAVLRARYSFASAGFFNPFGSTITPGSRRGDLSLEFKPLSKSILHFGLTTEANHTANVDNTRFTLSAAWDQMVSERFRLHLGYDHRSFVDSKSDDSRDSSLITVGAEVTVTDKLQISAKREQNLTEADPTYPNQTTLAATYQFNTWSKLFFTQRLASAAITPIGDFSHSGFAFTGSQRETAIGVETRFTKYTSVTGRYEIDNGINGTDSFAVIGLQNRLPINPELSLELGFERGFHLLGNGQAFNSATVGIGWTPSSDFRASARYEFRDRGGIGQLFTIGAAGRITEGITALSRFQWSRTGFEGRNGTSLSGLAALAIRPVSSDRVGLLFSYNHRSSTQDGVGGVAPTRDRIDTLATDGYFQATKRLELYGRFALRFSATGQADLPYASTLTYLTQARAQYRLSRRFDWAGETRLLFQPSSSTDRLIYGTELGFWALPDLRLGVGYNYTFAGEPGLLQALGIRRGFYFTITSKLSNLFNLLGTSKDGLAPAGTQQEDQKKGEIH